MSQNKITTSSTIVVTGAAGFIGSCLTGYLNRKGYESLILVDEFERIDKIPNLEGKKWKHQIERDQFFQWLDDEKPAIDFIFHLGARTDTTEFDYEVHRRLNFEYSQDVWDYAVVHRIPLVYASSAATYGAGKSGYSDDHELIPKLEPLNAYGQSKQDFDLWVLQQHSKPPFWAGLKFFNVYGPNEYHKGRMASVIFHSFHQIKERGYVNLFRSHRQDYKDGEQLRDFIYVVDILKVCDWLMTEQSYPAIFNLGTGEARSFYDLAKATFAGLDLQPDIRFIDMPMDLRETYQYYTRATMDKLHEAGYHEPFYSLEKGVDDYVRHYLAPGKYY